MSGTRDDDPGANALPSEIFNCDIDTPHKHIVLPLSSPNTTAIPAVAFVEAWQAGPNKINTKVSFATNLVGSELRAGFTAEDASYELMLRLRDWLTEAIDAVRRKDS